jgi:hypothetical protein
MYFALKNYAKQHNGFYPDSDLSSLDALRKLYPEFVVGVELAGITGDRESLESKLTSGLPLDDVSTSWVYVPGLKESDDPELAVLWESRPGFRHDGRRDSRLGRAVLFNKFAIEYIPENEWEHFIKNQAARREKAFMERSDSGRTRQP